MTEEIQLRDAELTDVYIFGVNEPGLIAGAYLAEQRSVRVRYLDNDKNKQNTKTGTGFPVDPPSVLKADDTVIIALVSEAGRKSVEEQVRSLGCRKIYTLNRDEMRIVRDLISDRAFILALWQVIMKKPLDLSCPVTYNEKLQWLKLYYRNPLLGRLVDKEEVKSYVRERIGDEAVIPTIGLWESPEEIDFESLPDQFVLKCTHDSGGTCICRDRDKLDEEKVKAFLGEHLKKNFYYLGREWPYRDVKPRIIAEPYLEDEDTKELRDYKFFCFDGKARIMFVASDRFLADEPYFDFFDTSFRHLDIVNGHPNADFPIKKPASFEQMLQAAEKLSEGLPHARVDFYEVNGKMYFGEMTFYHFSGFVPFNPPEWDVTMGEWLTLPEKTGEFEC